MPKISVIVPIYKTEKYLTKCIESILAQTYEDLELLLIEDGSPDRCPQICDSFTAKDPRVHVIHKKNGGVSSARNAGLNVAKGDYIAFVDSDDYIEPNMYEKMLAVAEKYNCDVVMCDCVKEYPDYCTAYHHPIRSGYYSKEQLRKEYYSHLLIMENVEYPPSISNWTLLWRNTLNTEGMRFEPGIRFSEDLLFGAKLLYNADSFYYLAGENLYHYRMNNQSVTHVFKQDKWADYQRLHKKIAKTFSNTDDYDFSNQIQKCLLFFLYDSVGDIMRTNQLSQSKKISLIRSILNDNAVRTMFHHLNIVRLPISLKQKLITWIYKYRIGVGAVVAYYNRKG